MKFSILFFLVIVQSGALAAYTMLTSGEQCRQARIKLTSAHMYLLKLYEPEKVIASGNERQRSNEARSARIREAFESAKDAEDVYFKNLNNWGPKIDVAYKKKLTDAVDQTVKSLKAARPKFCFRDCDGLESVLGQALDVQAAKILFYINCNVEPVPIEEKKKLFKLRGPYKQLCLPPH